MALDLTSFQAALKTLYSEKKIENLVYKDNALLAMMPKMERFFGENLKQPLIYGNPQSRSATFSNALAQQAGSSAQLKAFLLTRVRDYALAQIDNETLKASESDMGAFLRAAQVQIDGAMQSISRSLAVSQYRNGSGSIGNIGSSALGGSVITLSNPDDVTNFEVGMVLQVSGTDGGTSVRVGTVQVSAVDRNVGTVTVSTVLNVSIPTIAASDFLFQQGDYDLKLKGLSAWLPYGGPSATPFFGVDRTADASRLAGIWQDGSSKPIEEALIDIAVRIAREGGRPDHCFMSYTDYANLEKALGSKVQYVNVNAPSMPEVGFRGMLIQGPKGPIKVIPDQNNSSSNAFMLQLDTWQLASLGKAPQLFNTDGLDMLRNSSSDSLDIRIYYYAQQSCNAPGFNGQVKLR
jgi:hypothetical protein